MSDVIFLSHALSEQTPGFGGVSGFQRSQVRKICDGSSSNSDQWTLSNHIGTHIDSPRHFSDAGACIDDFSPESWIFKSIALIDVPLGAAQLLTPDQIEEQLAKQAPGRPVSEVYAPELLLIRSGFEKYRGRDLYWSANPGVTAEAGAYLREKWPSIRVIGFDFLSLTSAHHREVGREAHRAFLDPARAGRPVLIIEDMHLANLQKAPSEVIVAPLRVSATDGAPVTIFARV